VQINVSARHGHLSPASQSKISAKVSRLQRYFDRLTALDVTVDLENHNLPLVEIIAKAEHFHDMVSRLVAERRRGGAEARTATPQAQREGSRPQTRGNRPPDLTTKDQHAV
jgi:putative sigma-54 modulation protein